MGVEASGAVSRLLRDKQADEVFELGRQMRDWLDPRDWEAADVRERFRITIAAHDRIRRAYGAEPKRLVFEPLDPDVSGGFDAGTGEVIIDPELLFEDDPLEVLKPLVHENRHDLQDQIIREHRERADASGTAGMEVRIWNAGDLSYTSRDPDLYHYNSLEVDSREAEGQFERGYLRRHIEHLSGGEARRLRSRTMARHRAPYRRNRHSWGRERGE